MATPGEELKKAIKAMNENSNAIWSHEIGKVDASRLKHADLSRPNLDLGQYYEGYASEVERLKSEGLVGPTQAADMLKSFPHPKEKEEDPLAGQEAMAFVLPPKDQWSDHFRHGFEEAVDLMRMRRRSDFPREGGSWSEYEFGYQQGITQKIREGAISVDRGRWFMGYLEEARPLYSPNVPTGSKFDPVKIPQHYNSGQIEVANFIADQQLDYVSGNVIKYVARAGKKDPAKEIEDLEKAAAYLQMRHNLANGLPAVVRDPETREVVWSLFKN